MLRFLITYDDNDASLGDYLTTCYNDISEFLKAANNTILVPLRGLLCTEQDVNTSIQAFDRKRFIFISYSHGLGNCLATTNGEFVNFKNSLHFKDSLFYSCACLSAKKLGPELINKGCISFIGYEGKVFVNEDYADVFIRCKNAGIKLFQSGGVTIGHAYNHMRSEYLKEIDRLAAGNGDDFIAASSLNSNVQTLKLLGSDSVTIMDFFADN